MKFLLLGLASMLVCKFMSWKSCSNCGSLRTRVIVHEHIGWDCEFDTIPILGPRRIQRKVKTCYCCGDEFLQQISAHLLLGRELNEYVENMILESIKELDAMLDSENQKTA